MSVLCGEKIFLFVLRDKKIYFSATFLKVLFYLQNGGLLARKSFLLCGK